MPSLFEKSFDVLVIDDAVSIIGWPESLTVEFKESLPGRDGRDDAWLRGGNVETYAKEKIWKEVVALANTVGGHVILGIEEGEGPPAVAVAIKPIPRCNELAERLSKAAQSIDPPIPMLQVRGIETKDDGGIVIFRVPASRSAPHRSTDKECYVRKGTDSIPMSMREIQDLTLASMQRENIAERKFESASKAFRRWSESRLGNAFRITANPAGATLNLGRLYGRPDLFSLRQGYHLRESRFSNLVAAYALNLPDRRIPIVRGERRTHSNDDANPVILDVHSDGLINVFFRAPQRQGENRLAVSWIAAYLLNVFQIANVLRNSAASPDVEFGIEVEIYGNPTPVRLVDWDTGLFRDDGELKNFPLTLPRVSLGSMVEADAVLSVILNDVYDASGIGLKQPVTISRAD